MKTGDLYEKNTYDIYYLVMLASHLNLYNLKYLIYHPLCKPYSLII
jgi:hypothetical protein